MSIESIGGRKVVLGLLVVLIGCLVDAFGKNGLTSNLLDLLKFIGVGFFLGNGLEHVAGAIGKKGVPPVSSGEPSVSPDPEPLLVSLKEDTLVSQKALQHVMERLEFLIKKAGF